MQISQIKRERFLSHISSMTSRAGLSRCSRIGPRAMVFGQIVHFGQIHLALENSVETPYNSVVNKERYRQN